MSFKVRFTSAAAEDLERLFDFVLERELQRNDGDLELADRALEAIPFGHTGYVALFEIVDSSNVVIAAVRHQREEDYH